MYLFSQLNTLKFEELSSMYEFIDGWIAFYFFDNIASKNYTINSLIEYTENKFIFRNKSYNILTEFKIFILNKKNNENINLDEFEKLGIKIDIELFKNRSVLTKCRFK